MCQEVIHRLTEYVSEHQHIQLQCCDLCSSVFDRQGQLVDGHGGLEDGGGQWLAVSPRHRQHKHLTG